MAPNNEIESLTDSLKIIVENSPTAVALFDKQMRYIWASESWIRDYQLEGINVIGQCQYDVLPGIPEHWKEMHKRCLAGSNEHVDEESFLRPDGKIIWMRREMRPWRKASREIGGLVIFSVDITEKKIIQEKLETLNENLEKLVQEKARELEASEKRHRDTVESAVEGIFDADLNGRFTHVNEAGCKMLGYTKEEIVTKRIVDILPPDEIPKLEWTLQEQSQANKTHLLEWTLLRKDGSPVQVEAATQTVGGNRRMAFVRDISDRKQAEAALLASEQKYRALFESAYDSLLVTDKNGKIILVNKQLEQVFGYNREELYGQPIEILMPEKYRQNHSGIRKNYVSAPLARPMGKGLTLYGRRKDGTEFPIDISLNPSTDSGDMQITAIIRDISDRKRFEDQQAFLGQAAKNLAMALGYKERLQTMADMIVPKIADICVFRLVEGGILRAKAFAAEDKSKTHLLEELMEKGVVGQGPYSATEVLVTGQPALIVDTHKEIMGNTSVNPSIKVFVEMLDVTSFVVVPLISRGKTLGTVTLTMTDSARRFSESDMRFIEEIASRCAVAFENALFYQEAQQAVAARENILSIVSHDLRNPLAVIDSSIQLLQANTARPDQVASLSERVKTSCSAMKRLINDLLDFGKMEAGGFAIKKDKVEINSLVDSALAAVLPKAVEKNITVSVPDLRAFPSIYGDEGRIVQVLWNIIGNAVKFTPKGGHIDIQVEVMDSFVQFSISDNGSGISAEELPKIFDRYWQAQRATRDGAGLGLSIAMGIVSAHGGKIWVESKRDSGTCVFFTIPIFRSTREEDRGNLIEKRLGGVRVLAVDDSVEMSALIEAFLEISGADVTIAHSLDEALTKYELFKPQIVVTDIEMPGGGGYELLRRIRSHDGDTPVLAMTGHVGDAELENISKAGFSSRISKPFSSKLLVSTIEKFISSDGATTKSQVLTTG